MNSIVIIYQPFAIEQMVILYKDGEVAENHRCPIERVPMLIEEISQHQGVSSVNLIGNSDYLGRFQKEILGKVPTNVSVNIVK